MMRMGHLPAAKEGFYRVEGQRSAVRLKPTFSCQQKITKEKDMKKLILIAGAALLLAGCNQGGTSDQYGTSSGTNTSSSYDKGAAPRSPANNGSSSNAIA